MIHRDHHKKQHSHVWFGFTLGTVIGATGLFLLGTTQGRKLLKKAMEMAEHLETSTQDMLTHLENKDIVEPLVEHTPLHKILQKIQTVLPQHHASEKPSMRTTQSTK